MNEKYFDHHDPCYSGHFYNGEDPNDYEFERALHNYEKALKTYFG